jgi:DNA/RNA-binding domain of Phe-tRNA-synthetase-like protein
VKFTVDSAVFQKLPGAVFGVAAARLDNSAPKPEIARVMQKAAELCKNELGDANIKEHPAILPYREAFTALGMNPNKYMCSIEALCKRVQKGAELPGINPVVDIGNAVSLKYMLPIGAHDLGRMSGDFYVRFSRPGDSFTPFGSAEAESPDPGELVYVTGSTVKTRRWIWRQSEDGKIDGSSSLILFPIDGFEAFKERLLAARDELGALIAEHFGVTPKLGLIDAQNRDFEITV